MQKLLPASLPLRRTLAQEYVISTIIGLIMAASSLLGLIYSNNLYPTEEYRVGFAATDLLNLVVGIPILILSLLSASRGSLAGLLCWPGALLYVLYVYISHMATPTSPILIPYILLIALSACSIVTIVMRIDGEAVRLRLDGALPAKTTGSILIAIGVLVVAYQLYSIFSAIISQANPDRLEWAQWIADLVVGSPALLVGGYLLLRRKALGYVLGAGLLLMCSLLFIGVIPAMVFQAKASDVPIDIIGICVVLVIGLICFVPLWLFIRGIIRTSCGS